MILIFRKWYYEPVKRIIDIISAVVLAIIFLPVWLIVPLLIKLDSPGPIIYKHKRIGKGGREFWLYKFRTMVHNADDILYRKNPQLFQRFKKGDWKLARDPRITTLGRIMRSVTIDEFPQLFNIFKGEMSLVGPRAYLKQELISQQKKYPATVPLIKDILAIKPGVTGTWQTSGRNVIPFNERAQMDVDYAREKSLLQDLWIILKTPKAMFSKW